MITVHELKTVQPYFNAVNRGEKTFELRRDDRNFRTGDYLLLKEWDGDKFTGDSILAEVTYILYEYHDALNEPYVIMSIKVLR